jgi:hypothetical protein
VTQWHGGMEGVVGVRTKGYTGDGVVPSTHAGGVTGGRDVELVSHSIPHLEVAPHQLAHARSQILTVDPAKGSSRFKNWVSVLPPRTGCVRGDIRPVEIRGQFIFFK